MTELKECPFCGGEAKIVHPAFNELMVFIQCKICLSRSDIVNKDFVAVNRWNKRSTNGECVCGTIQNINEVLEK